MIRLSFVVEFFLLGLATPLAAPCVLPLYPGFVVYLSNQSPGTNGGDGSEAASDGDGSAGGEPGASATSERARTDGGRGYSPALLGVLVVVGVLAFMLGIGLLFTALLQVSLTVVTGVVSPLAFGFLALLSVALLLDLGVFSRIPTVDPPQHRHPAVTALGYGFFFGAIVLPCNPTTIAYLLARSSLQVDPVGRMSSVLAFGLGMGAPLLGLAVVSEPFGRRLTRAMARHRTAINRVAGAVMLYISVYYLLAVFDVFGIGTALGV